MVSSVLKKLDLTYEGIEEDLPDYINSGLSVLYKRQHDDDGWGWYENDDTDPYMTAYVLYGLIEANRILPETGIDIKVDEGVIKRGTASLISQLDEIEEDSVRVYALYVLSHTDSLKLEWLDEMFDKAYTLTAISKAMLLLAYENMGVEGKARTLYNMLLAERIEEDGYVHWGYAGEEFYWWQWEADELETTAYMLRVMARRDIDNPLIPKAIRWLIINRTGSYWRSTKASGKIIYAMSDYLSRTGEMHPDYDLSLMLNGEELVDVHVNKNNMLGDFTTIRVSDDKLKTGENTIELKKDGPGSVYYSSVFTYFADVGDIEPLSSGFDVKREYYLLKKEVKGREIKYVKEPLVGPVLSGDEILVKVDVTTGEASSYFLLEDYFPAGCEPITDDEDYLIAGDDFYDGRYHYWYAGREIRDERIALSLSYMSKGTHTFKYILRAQVPGVFEVMPSEAYLMYYPDRYGRTESGELVINEAK